jgi:hypothetical protein
MPKTKSGEAKDVQERLEYRREKLYDEGLEKEQEDLEVL